MVPSGYRIAACPSTSGGKSGTTSRPWSLRQVLLVAVDRNGGGTGRTDNVVRIGRQRENDCLVRFGNRIVDGLDSDLRVSRTRLDISMTAKPPVIHPIGRCAADRVEYAQRTINTPAGASDAEFAGVSREFGGIRIGGGDGNSRQCHA